MSPRRFAVTVVCAIAVGWIAVAEPGVADEKLPASVAADVKSNADLCTEAGGKADTSQAVKRADLNGDGKPDFVFLNGWIHCAGFASLYGDREKVLNVYAGDGAGGAVAAFTGMVFDATLEGTGAATKLWLGVSGTDCGKPPAPDFASENFCDRALVWNAKAKKFEYAPVSTVRMIQ
jgi:hypothetical protein